MVVEAFGNGHRIAFDMPADVAKAALQVPGVGADHLMSTPQLNTERIFPNDEDHHIQPNQVMRY